MLKAVTGAFWQAQTMSEVVTEECGGVIDNFGCTARARWSSA